MENVKERPGKFHAFTYLSTDKGELEIYCKAGSMHGLINEIIRRFWIEYEKK